MEILMSEQKLCKDCRFCEKPIHVNKHPSCLHLDANMDSVSVVTGIEQKLQNSCFFMRSLPTSPCGLDAKLFEPMDGDAEGLENTA